MSLQKDEARLEDTNSLLAGTAIIENETGSDEVDCARPCHNVLNFTPVDTFEDEHKKMLTRSMSCEIDPPKFEVRRRKKCDSESNAADFVSDDHTLEGTISLFKENYLKEVLESYVAKMVNDCISNAIRDIKLQDIPRVVVENFTDAQLSALNIVNISSSPDECSTDDNNCYPEDEDLIKTDKVIVDVHSKVAVDSSQRYDGLEGDEKLENGTENILSPLRNEEGSDVSEKSQEHNDSKPVRGNIRSVQESYSISNNDTISNEETKQREGKEDYTASENSNGIYADDETKNTSERDVVCETLSDAVSGDSSELLEQSTEEDRLSSENGTKHLDDSHVSNKPCEIETLPMSEEFTSPVIGNVPKDSLNLFSQDNSLNAEITETTDLPVKRNVEENESLSVGGGTDPRVPNHSSVSQKLSEIDTPGLGDESQPVIEDPLNMCLGDDSLNTEITEVTNSSVKENVHENESSCIASGTDTRLPDDSLNTETPATENSSVDAKDDSKSKNEDEKKMNWKVGYLYVKLPHKSRSKGKLKAWKKRCVSIQPDEFANDPAHPCAMLSVYSGESGSARKHSASFWISVSSRKAAVHRGGSRTHRFAFTVAEEGKPVVHLSADCEAVTQEWMAALRCILWPPSPVVQLEKMLNGKEFEVSIIDNDFSLRAGLLGMYGYMAVTPRKLILLHPQQGYVIQEWYLNTVDNFQLVHQQRIEDVHKVLAMTTCSDSSTGKGEILLFCKEAVQLLQCLASTIHNVLEQHSQKEGGKYQRQLQELAEWFGDSQSNSESHYQVPPKQVKSLLDIPNFIFNRSLSPVASETSVSGESMEKRHLVASNVARGSQDSGISSGTTSDDFLNCSLTSFVIGGGVTLEKSSDSELSDTYTPPLSPLVEKKNKQDLEKDLPVMES